MTLAEELSTLRNTIKEVDKDSVIPDSLLYTYWSKARATVIKQEINRRNKIPQFMYKRYCLELEKVKSVECDCEDLQNSGCDILKSKINIPEYIGGNTNEGLQIYTLGNETIGLVMPNVIKSDRLDEIKSKKARAIIPNRKLEIWNDLGKTRIYIRMIPEDLMAWAELPVCDNEGNTYCPDVMNEDAGLSKAMSDAVSQIVLTKYLGLAIQIPDDRSQDRNTNTN